MNIHMQTGGTSVKKSIMGEVLGKERPWHETLPDTLDVVSQWGEAKLIGDQILATKLPKNFRPVRDSWAGMCQRVGYRDGRVDDKLQRLIRESDEAKSAEIGSEAAGDDIGAER